MSDITYDAEELDRARTQVRRNLGAALAGKASDDLLVAAARRTERLDTGSGSESFGPGGPLPPLATVVEFDGTPAAESITDGPGLEMVTHDLEAALGSVTGGPTLRAPQVLRPALIAAARRESYRVMGAVYNEIERLSGGVLRPSPEVLGAPEIPTLVNQVCWLNRSVRTYAGPESLAEVAEDPSVTAVDLPRRLMPDAETRSQRTIGMPAPRLAQVSGRNITVAVIDSEVTLDHPALKDRVVQRRNYTREPWGSPGAHGTAVAGIIAADDPQFGGMAPEALIYSYKVLATNRTANGDDFSGALAIQQALEDGIDIANCSWGAGPVGSGTSREARAADAAWALGMVIVKSAGNRGPNANTMTTPADAQGIIVVGATDVDGTAVQGYSSGGPAGGRPGPHVVAPGGNAQAFVDCCLVAGGFGNAGFGTSYAAPHVSGLVALLLECEPHLLPDQIRDRLVQTARLLPGVAEQRQGAGLVLAS